MKNSINSNKIIVCLKLLLAALLFVILIPTKTGAEAADVIIAVSPSYWADVPGQFKAFIDRCTPWCNTHEPHARLQAGKKGYAVALRTGPGMKECERVISSIEHFYGHLEIGCRGHLGLCSVEYREDVEARGAEIEDFCRMII